MDAIKNHLAAQIRKWMKDNHISGKQLGKMIGRTAQTVSGLTKGNNLTITNLLLLSKVTGHDFIQYLPSPTKEATQQKVLQLQTQLDQQKEENHQLLQTVQLLENNVAMLKELLTSKT